MRLSVVWTAGADDSFSALERRVFKDENIAGDPAGSGGVLKGRQSIGENGRGREGRHGKVGVLALVRCKVGE